MSQAPLALYGYWRSSASWRVRIGLGWKGLAYEYLPVHLVRDGGEQHAEAYRRLNPMAQVPTLVLPDGQKLSQSLAILEYLEATHPEPPLLPRDPYLAARTRQYAELMNSGIQPLHNVGVLNELKRRGTDEQSWARAAIEKGLSALEASAAPTAGRFLVGDQVSLADVCLVPQLYAARRFAADLTLCPRLVEIEARCAELPAFAQAHADRQPDAVKT